MQQASAYNLLLLDVMMPGLTGLEVCRQLRGQGHSLPILLITARDRLEDKVSGLDAGADDSLIKPFQLAELLARVRALLHRAPRSELAVFQVADLSLDPGSGQDHRGGREVRLSSTEFALLEVLMRNRGQGHDQSQPAGAGLGLRFCRPGQCFGSLHQLSARQAGQRSANQAHPYGSRRGLPNGRLMTTLRWRLSALISLLLALVLAEQGRAAVLGHSSS